MLWKQAWRRPALLCKCLRGYQPACFARFIPYLRKYIAANNGIKTKSGLMYVFSSANDDVSIKIYMAVVATYVTRNATNIFPEPTSSSIGNTFAQNT